MRVRDCKLSWEQSDQWDAWTGMKSPCFFGYTYEHEETENSMRAPFVYDGEAWCKDT